MWWNSLSSRIDSLVNEVQAQGLILVCCEKSHFHTFYSGYIHQGGANTSMIINGSTKFQIASISKFVTSYLCLKLELLGLIDLNISINELLGSMFSFKPNTLEPSISIKNLLGHAAGFNGPHGIFGTESQHIVLPEIKRFIKSPNSFFDPAHYNHHQYSFISYFLIQSILEKLFGQSFEYILNNYLLMPLGINDYVSTKDQRWSLQPIAIGYSPVRLQTGKGFLYYPQAEAAAGLWFSGEEFAKLLCSLLDNNLSADNSFIRFPSFLTAPTLNGSNYHLGLEFLKREGNSVFQHSGCNPGYISFFMASAKKNRSFFIFSNDGSAGNKINWLKTKMLRLMHS